MKSSLVHVLLGQQKLNAESEHILTLKSFYTDYTKLYPYNFYIPGDFSNYFKKRRRKYED